MKEKQLKTFTNMKHLAVCSLTVLWDLWNFLLLRILVELVLATSLGIVKLCLGVQRMNPTDAGVLLKE